MVDAGVDANSISNLADLSDGNAILYAAYLSAPLVEICKNVQSSLPEFIMRSTFS